VKIISIIHIALLSTGFVAACTSINIQKTKEAILPMANKAITTNPQPRKLVSSSHGTSLPNLVHVAELTQSDLLPKTKQ